MVHYLLGCIIHNTVFKDSLLKRVHIYTCTACQTRERPCDTYYGEHGTQASRCPYVFEKARMRFGSFKSAHKRIQFSTCDTTHACALSKKTLSVQTIPNKAKSFGVQKIGLADFVVLFSISLLHCVSIPLPLQFRGVLYFG